MSVARETPAGEVTVSESAGRLRPFSYRRWIVFTVLVFLIHLPFLSLPYFWDELGQFVPAALDIYHDGAWVPHSAVPNAHAPGVMAYLALVWRIFGYSIPHTRAAMLVLAAVAVLYASLLAARLCHGLGRIPVFVATLLLLLDPLFYMQSMLAQLDMPAMLFTVLALLLFLEDHHAASALACTGLVLAKETGALLPLILGVTLLLDPERRKSAAFYLAPFVVLAAWFLALWSATGHWFGDTGFTEYNITYSLHPVRVLFSLLRRTYYLFIADFRWVGTAAIVLAWKNSRIYSSRGWKITWCFLGAHVLLVSLLGGAELERYLLPVVPLVYIAMGAAWLTVSPLWRNAGIAAAAAGLVAGLFINPPYPFPFENNLAMVDFVQLHRAAAQFLEQTYPGQTIYTAWPLTQALRDPAFGYARRELSSAETTDLHYSTLNALDPGKVNVLVLYSRAWEPRWGVLGWPLVRAFLSRYYQYERQMNSTEVGQHFGLIPIRRWDQRGQWIEIYGRTGTFSRKD
jgi:4-amino-4-deoxy-L-arabinose transferase-like glycosyltransferase